MTGPVTVCLRPTLGGAHKGVIERAETVIYIGTGDCIVERPEAARRIFCTRRVRSDKMEQTMRFFDQS